MPKAVDSWLQYSIYDDVNKNDVWFVSYAWFTWPRWWCHQPISFVKQYFCCNFKFHSMFGNQAFSGSCTLPKLLRVWLETVFLMGQFSYNCSFQESRFKGTLLVATCINFIARLFITANVEYFQTKLINNIFYLK